MRIAKKPKGFIAFWLPSSPGLCGKLVCMATWDPVGKMEGILGCWRRTRAEP